MHHLGGETLRNFCQLAVLQYCVPPDVNLLRRKYVVCAGLRQDSNYRDAFKHAQTYLLISCCCYCAVQHYCCQEHLWFLFETAFLTRCKSAPQCPVHANMAS